MESRLGEGNSNYDALGAKLTQRFSGGLMFLASYTWSKAIDNGSAIWQSTNDYFGSLNTYDLKPERGLSAYNLGQRFSGSLSTSCRSAAENLS